jgi:energy-coupling factor transporter ATP-binding protein EcfA2
MNYIKDEILKKYIAGEIESDNQKSTILELNKENFKICEGKTILTSGEMTLIVGGKNSGKSKLVNHLIKQILLEKCDNGFSIPNANDYRVVFFDSEMGESRLVDWSIKSPFEDDLGKDYLHTTLKDKLFLYTLKREKSSTRLDCISSILKDLKKEFPYAHFIVCLDVGTCLTSDTNSSLNGGTIDDLMKIVAGSTLVVTIHHSLKDESKNGISMGSIGTALEKFCAIKLLISPTDSDKRHKVEFLVSKYEDVDKDKDYFYLHTEKNTEGKIHINGISDSLGLIIRKKGNEKVNDDEFANFLINLIKNSYCLEDRLRKNVRDLLMEKFDLGKSSVYNKIDQLIADNILIEDDGELLVK